MSKKTVKKKSSPNVVDNVVEPSTESVKGSVDSTTALPGKKSIWEFLGISDLFKKE